jgi:signal transduction histidine kinase
MAITELVKNAYDADSTRVTVRLSGVEDPTAGCIEIRDDGSGMSLETVLDAWLEPATSFKRRRGFKERTERGRYPLGEKGVGRFAADKLGAELELVTRAAAAADEVSLQVSWDRFVDGEYLDQIQNSWELQTPVEFAARTGTLLRVRQLRTAWSRLLVERVQDGLARLISPATPEGDFSVILEAEDFPELSGPVRNRLLDTAPYRLTGVVLSDGRLRAESRDPELIDLREHAGDHFRTRRGRGLRQPACGPFRISLSVWDLDALGNGETRLSRPMRALLRRNSGVSIYRDSFRVAPYGNSGDDWLELNQRRVNNPTMRISTNQIVALVEITQEANPDLRDRTSREGLIDTPAFHDLRALVVAALSILEEERYACRQSRSVTPPGSEADPVMGWLERARLGGARGPALKMAIDSYRKYRREAERRENVLLRVASAGAAAEALLGQLNGSVSALARTMPLLQRQIAEPGQLDRIREHLALVARQLDALERLRSASDQQVTRVDLRSVAQDAASAYAPLLQTCSVELSIRGDSGVTVHADRSLLLQALMHVVENAVLAAAEMSQHRWVEIEIGSDPARLAVRDSAYGVPDRRRELIFDPFFTTREGCDGLGLYFARTLVRSGGHDLVLTERGDEFCFRFSSGETH